MTEWRDIATAPKDGTKIDIWARDSRTVNVYWSDLQGWWCTDGLYGPEEPSPLPIFPAPSHWQPLPQPPALIPVRNDPPKERGE